MSKPKTGGQAASAPYVQYAALPWRAAAAGGVEVLLITSRQTRRWVIPKGWPIRGLTPSESAAREAFEEAGVEGVPARQPIGRYSYLKRLSGGAPQTLQVTVFPLHVLKEADRWPEKRQREKRWTPLQEAAEWVEEPELRDILRAACLSA
jgi:8-oxo-dGTP pyrophosphatase MutT (NUDIX family)